MLQTLLVLVSAMLSLLVAATVGLLLSPWLLCERGLGQIDSMPPVGPTLAGHHAVWQKLR